MAFFNFDTLFGRRSGADDGRAGFAESTNSSYSGPAADQFDTLAAELESAEAERKFNDQPLREATDDLDGGRELSTRTILGLATLDYELEIQRITFNRPRWLTSDTLLREEGVSFGMGLRGTAGLTDEAVQKKLATIADWFRLRALVFQKRVEQIDDELGRLSASQLLLSSEGEYAQLKATTEAMEHREAVRVLIAQSQPGMLARRTLQTVGLCIATLVQATLIYWYLSGSYEQLVTLLLTASVWLLGNASTRPRMSYFLTDKNPNSRALWKQQLEDIGLPAAATLITLAIGYATHPWITTLALAPAIYAGFAFIGRGAFRELAALPELYGERRRGRKLLKHSEEVSTTSESHYLDLRQRTTNDFATDFSKLRNERHMLELRIVSIQQELVRKQNLFLSEFHLAIATPSFVDADN